jgi:hypothetical protein
MNGLIKKEGNNWYKWLLLSMVPLQVRTLGLLTANKKRSKKKKG